MEVLNNIWIAISTPNEGLISILAIPSTLLENLLIMYLFLSILGICASKKQKITYVVLMSFISLISMYIIPNPFNIIFNYIIMLILSYSIFKFSFLKSFIAIITSIIIFALIGTLILNPYITLLNIESNLLNSIPIYKFGYLFIMYLSAFILSVIIKNRNIKLELLEDIDSKNKLIIIGNLIFGLIALIVQLIITIYYTDKLPIIITFLSFISLLAYFSINIYY